MSFQHLRLSNWRNFREVDVPLERRVFLIGPNASGKSNLLDAFRFLRDIADPEGGFQRAVRDRGGVSQIRCLHARRHPSVGIEVEVRLGQTVWSYQLEFSQDNQRRPVLREERVARDGELLLTRPDRDDEADASRLSQTHLEQVNANARFRELADFLARVRYLHVVPQLIREDVPRQASRVDDPYGGDFLEKIASAPKRTMEARLRRINKALQVAVPQLEDLTLERDARGVPHLKGRYVHWRPNAGWQTEEHFSDGTLRLLGLLWAILDGDAPLLLEEPELSLHAGVVRFIPSMIARAGTTSNRQVLISTHSPELLGDEGIAAEEVLLVEPSQEGSRVRVAAAEPEIRELLDAGFSIAEAALPRTTPRDAAQLVMFGN